MKFECKKEDLVNCISVVGKAIATKTTNSILECFLIEVAGNEVVFKGFDGNVSIYSKIKNVKVLEEGKTCIDAKLFEQIVLKLPDVDIFVHSINETSIEIKANKSAFKLVAREESAYPQLTTIAEAEKFTLLGSELKNLIRSVIFSISTDTGRVVLTGALLEIENSCLNMVTIDGYRVSKKSIKNDSLKGLSLKAIIPASTLNKLLRILHENVSVEISIENNLIRFLTEDFCLISNLIDGDFLDYSQIINGAKSYENEMTINKDVFVDALNRVSILCTDSKTPIIFEVQNGNLKLISKNPVASSEEDVEVLSISKDITVGFNVKFILDAVKCIESDIISIKYDGDIKGFLFEDLTNLGEFFMLPVRLK